MTRAPLATRLTMGISNTGEHDPFWQSNRAHLEVWSLENKRRLSLQFNLHVQLRNMEREQAALLIHPLNVIETELLL